MRSLAVFAWGLNGYAAALSPCMTSKGHDEDDPGWALVSADGLTHLKAWIDRIDARPAVQKALTIPKAQPQFWDAEVDVDAFLKENAARFACDVKGA